MPYFGPGSAYALDANRAGSIAYRHPEFDARWWHWEFQRVCYVGGREYYQPARLSVEFQYPEPEIRNSDGQLVRNEGTVGGGISRVWYRSMLFRNAREDEWEYYNRQKRSYYYNFVRLVVDTIVSHATKQPPTRSLGGEDEAAEMAAPPTPEDIAPPDAAVDGEADSSEAGTPASMRPPAPTTPPGVPPPKQPEKAPSPIEEFWEAVDEDRRISLDAWMQDGLRWAAVYGVYWACMDVRPEPEGDGRPYVYWVSPLDVWDWSVGEDGEIEWLKQFVYTESERTWDQPVKPVSRFRIWYKDRVEEYEQDGRGGHTLLETRPYTIGRVPWEPVFYRRNCDALFPDGHSLIGDLARIATNVYNLCSQLNEVIDKQTYGQLVIPGTVSQAQRVQMGVTRYLTFDPSGSGGKPEYISPDPENPRVLMEAIGAQLEIARQMIGTGKGRSEGSKQQASADALELESEDKKSVLTDVASAAEDFERRLAGLFQAYETGPDASIDDLYISYQRDFDLRTFGGQIAEVLSFQQVGLPPMVNDELIKELVSQHFAKMPPDKLNALLDTCVAQMAVKRQQQLDMQMQALQTAKMMGPGPANPGAATGANNIPRVGAHAKRPAERLP